MVTLQDLIPQEVWAQLPDVWFFTNKKHTRTDISTISQAPQFASRPGTYSRVFVENALQVLGGSMTIVHCLAGTSPARLSHFATYLHAVRLSSVEATTRLAALTTIAQAPSSMISQDLWDTIEAFGPQQSSVPHASLYEHLRQLLHYEIGTALGDPLAAVTIPQTFWDQATKRIDCLDWLLLTYPLFEDDSTINKVTMYAEYVWEASLPPVTVEALRSLSSSHLRQRLDVL